MFTKIARKFISLHPKAFINQFSPFVNSERLYRSVTPLKKAGLKHKQKHGIRYETPPGSKYAPLSPIESVEEFISSSLRDKTSMTDGDWDDFKSDVIDKQPFISEENFSSIVMNILLLLNQLDLSHNFLRYAEKSIVKPNFLTYLKYISLCSQNRKAVNQDLILRNLDKVMKQIDSSPVLDVKCAQYVIQGLCATDRWKESFKYLDKLVNTKPNREICNALACAAIRNNDEMLAWEILTKWMNSYENLSSKVIEEFLLVALSRQKTNCRESDKFIQKLFQYMQKYDTIINLDVAKLIEQYFMCHRLKWKITFTKVSRKGICENCNLFLNFFELRNNEFNELREAFLRRVLMKSDLYINTNKREFENYLKFIDLHKPFHIVLDGLNAAFSCPGYQSRNKVSFQLLNVVKKMSGKSRKLLVLGRKHMKDWPDIQSVSQKAKLFFMDNISQDDPFVIYAALASGPHTIFLSADLMRDHMSRLEDSKLIHIFKRWQQSHQMFVKSDSPCDIKFIEPLRHSITIQGDMESGWHIPFDDKIILDPYEELNNWMCIEKII